MEYYFFGGNKPERKNNNHNIDIQGIIFVVLWTLFMCLLLCRCSTSKEFHKTVDVQHDTIRITQTEYKIDSIWRDRVQLIEFKGDSVYIRDSIFVEKWRIRTNTDTLWKLQFIYQTDTVNIENTTPIVKHERSGYDRFVSWGFWILVVLLILGVAWWVVKTFVLRR